MKATVGVLSTEKVKVVTQLTFTMMSVVKYSLTEQVALTASTSSLAWNYRTHHIVFSLSVFLSLLLPLQSLSLCLSSPPLHSFSSCLLLFSPPSLSCTHSHTYSHLYLEFSHSQKSLTRGISYGCTSFFFYSFCPRNCQTSHKSHMIENNPHLLLFWKEEAQRSLVRAFHFYPKRPQPLQLAPRAKKHSYYELGIKMCNNQ